MTRFFALPLVLAAALGACRPGPSRPDAGRPAPAEPLPAAICTAGTRWSAGTRAFEDRTAAWGLDALDVVGLRMSVVDLEGDGWADVVVRRAGVSSDDFAANTRATWVLRNTGRGTFEDVTAASGLVTPRALADGRGRPGEVMVFGDVDGDGDEDAYVGLSTAEPAKSLGETSEILLNDGAGKFTLGPAENPVRRAGQTDVPAGAAFVDVDGDGRLDLWVGQHNTADFLLQSDRLWRGLGDGTFADATEDAGLRTENWGDLDALNGGRAHSRAWSAAACDLNSDGLPELLAASYGRAPNHLWQAAFRTDGTLRYDNRSVASGYAYDENFSWQDNEFARCFCRSNPDAPGCAGVDFPSVQCSDNWNHGTDREPFRLGGNSGATVCADVDNDGDLDLFTTEIKHWWAGAGADGSEWLVNTGEPDVRFTRPGRAATGLEIPHATSDWDEGHMTASTLDFDNDGWQDLYVGGSDYPGNRGLLFHQASALRFEPVPPADGIDHLRSHGIAVADFDRDGDQDVLVGHSRSRCGDADDCYPTGRVRFFENVGDAGNWLQLDLEGGAHTNRSAIGARVLVEAGGVTQTQEVGGGYGHYGARNDRVLHFGLGTACEATVSIYWPNAGRTADVHRLPAGHRFHVGEGRPPRALPPSAP